MMMILLKIVSVWDRMATHLMAKQKKKKKKTGREEWESVADVDWANITKRERCTIQGRGTCRNKNEFEVCSAIRTNRRSVIRGGIALKGKKGELDQVTPPNMFAVSEAINALINGWLTDWLYLSLAFAFSFEWTKRVIGSGFRGLTHWDVFRIVNWCVSRRTKRKRSEKK